MTLAGEYGEKRVMERGVASHPFARFCGVDREVGLFVYVTTHGYQGKQFE
jgi:hypothetical protein